MRNIARYLCPLLLAVSVHAEPQESLLIAPGDLVHIQVFDTPELEQHARVTDSGTVELALGGNVKISGESPSEAARTISQVLREKNLLKNPHITVSIEEYATQKVSVLGEVRAPGAYLINTPRSILDVLTLAGGLTDLADRRIVIRRHSTSEAVSYVVSNDAQSALASAVMVQPGDTVIVPKANLVYILGDVRLPGGYTMTNNHGTLTALELLARAGGANNTAMPSHARLIRRTDGDYHNTKLPLGKIQKGDLPDEKLEADDILYIPFSFLKSVGATTTSGIVSSLGGAAVYRF